MLQCGLTEIGINLSIPMGPNRAMSDTKMFVVVRKRPSFLSDRNKT